jgi:hypothetical protein
MFASLFSTAQVDALTAEVVVEMQRLLPPARLGAASKADDKARKQLDEKIRKRVQAFAAGTRLNVYQKAKLGTRLQAALEAAGYPSEFSKPFAYDVVTMLALASPPPSSR